MVTRVVGFPKTVYYFCYKTMCSVLVVPRFGVAHAPLSRNLLTHFHNPSSTNSSVRELMSRSTELATVFRHSRNSNPGASFRVSLLVNKFVLV